MLWIPVQGKATRSPDTEPAILALLDGLKAPDFPVATALPRLLAAAEATSNGGQDAPALRDGFVTLVTRAQRAGQWALAATILSRLGRLPAMEFDASEACGVKEPSELMRSSWCPGLTAGAAPLLTGQAKEQADQWVDSGGRDPEHDRDLLCAQARLVGATPRLERNCLAVTPADQSEWLALARLECLVRLFPAKARAPLRALEERTKLQERTPLAYRLRGIEEELAPTKGP